MHRNGHPNRRAPLSQRLERNRNNRNNHNNGNPPPPPQIMSHSIVLKSPPICNNIEIYELLPDPNS